MTTMGDDTKPAYEATGPVARSKRSGALAIGGAGILLMIGAAGFVLAATPAATPGAPGATASSGASVSPGASTAPQGGPFGFGPGRGLGPSTFGFGRGGPGRPFAAVHVTAIDGSKVSLATDDGWTRTITVTSSTTVVRAGQTIAAGDLKVGDDVVFAETRGADGTWTITRLEVVLPTVAGQVTAKASDSITIKRFDGTTETIHVGSGTSYRTRASSTASLADVAVGDLVIATGTARSDGSIDAVQVLVGQPSAVVGRGGFGFGFGPHGPKGAGQNAPTPAPSAATG